jgi:hypothetical protein
MDLMTEEQFKAAMPVTIKKNINPAIIDDINNALLDSETREQFKENLLSYTSVMKEGRFKITGYINAVKYVSFKLLGSTNKDAYIKTFPDKYVNFLACGVPQKDIASYSTAFNGSKLVQLIFAQSMMPTHVLNAPMFQEALNTQADLMMTAKSEKVRSDAANSLLTHLKPPEVAKVELDVTLKQDESIKELAKTTMELARAQRLAIEAGARTPKAIAESNVINITPDSDKS